MSVLDLTLVVLIPVLRRPHRVQPVYQSISDTTPSGTRIIFIADPDDYLEREAIHEAGATALLESGNYAHKINAGVTVTHEELIFLGADDLLFHHDWLQVATRALEANPKAGVVGTNDLCNPRTAQGHSTHSLVTRSYARLGTIDDSTRLLHEGYPHEMVDDELIETARHRGAYVHAPDCIVEHLHPTAGKAPMDDLYVAREERMRAGRVIYEQRRYLWS